MPYIYSTYKLKNKFDFFWLNICLIPKNKGIFMLSNHTDRLA